MLEAGKLDRVVTFESAAETVSPSGAVSRLWVPLMTVRAEMREMRADEVATRFGEAENQAIVIVTRWHPTPISTGDRVLIDGKPFDIKGITEIGRRKGWKIVAVAQ